MLLTSSVELTLAEPRTPAQELRIRDVHLHVDLAATCLARQDRRVLVPWLEELLRVGVDREDTNTVLPEEDLTSRKALAGFRSPSTMPNALRNALLRPKVASTLPLVPHALETVSLRGRGWCPGTLPIDPARDLRRPPLRGTTIP